VIERVEAEPEQIETPEPPQPEYVHLHLYEAIPIMEATLDDLAGDFGKYGYHDWWARWLIREHLRLQKNGYPSDRALTIAAGALRDEMLQDQDIRWLIDDWETELADRAVRDNMDDCDLDLVTLECE
jgi:hypothetical protein